MKPAFLRKIGRVKVLPVDRVVDRVVEKFVEVEKLVEKTVFTPAETITKEVVPTDKLKALVKELVSDYLSIEEPLPAYEIKRDEMRLRQPNGEWGPWFKIGSSGGGGLSREQIIQLIAASGGGGTETLAVETSTNYTVPETSNRYVVLADSTSGDIVVTLPTAVARDAGNDVTVIQKNSGGGTITVAGASGQTINNEASVPLPVTVGTLSASDYDAATTWQDRGTDLTGIADGKQGTISAWIRIDGGNGLERHIFGGDGGFLEVDHFNLTQTVGNMFKVTASNTGGSVILGMSTDSTYTAGATWIHLLASWNLATGASHFYVQDVDHRNPGGPLTDDNIDYTQGQFVVGSSSAGSVGNGFNGCLCEVFFHTAYIDLSVTANRRKFIDASGVAVSFGANGSVPLGVQPLLYLKDGKTNLGSGGALTQHGTIASCSSAPMGSTFGGPITVIPISSNWWIA